MRRVTGWQLSLPRRRGAKNFDRWFLHLEPGYFTDLVRENPQAVITAEMGFRTLTALTYGTLFRKQVWVWWGGTLRTESNLPTWKRFLRFAIARWAKHWISYGRTSTEYLQSLRIPRERILQIQNCVNESWYSPAGEASLDVAPKPVLLHVGQLIPRKGIAELLRAAAVLQQRGLQFSLVLVGNGPERERLLQLSASLGLQNVHFLQALPPHAMAGMYRSANVLIFPTMEDVWGLVANEAVLSGLPVLCSKYAGCAAELFDQQAIFDPADEQEFVAALQKAIAGEVPRANPLRLLGTAQVAERIVKDIFASSNGLPDESYAS